MTTSPDDPDDTIAWIKRELQELDESPEVASMSALEHDSARAEIIMQGIFRLDEPMRSNVTSHLLAHLRGRLET